MSDLSEIGLGFPAIVTRHVSVTDTLVERCVAKTDAAGRSREGAAARLSEAEGDDQKQIKVAPPSRSKS
jgi:hypothetical protein